MVIDSHVHIGKIDKFNMPESMVIESMKKYNIDFSLVSNIEGIEVDCEQNIITKEYAYTQNEANRKTIDFAKANKDKIGALLWAKPRNEGCTEGFEKMIIENKDVVYGIKIHPYHSDIPFDSEEVEEYIKLADKYNLPILTHTAADENSHCKKVYMMAEKYKNVNFIMGHMGLETDNKEAIELIEKLPNLYGDTAWVDPKHVIEMIRKCGSDKILFGTDNPIDGIDTYAHPTVCSIYLSNIFKQELSKVDYENIMFRNAIKLFNLRIMDI